MKEYDGAKHIAMNKVAFFDIFKDEDNFIIPAMINNDNVGSLIVDMDGNVKCVNEQYSFYNKKNDGEVLFQLGNGKLVYRDNKGFETAFEPDLDKIGHDIGNKELNLSISDFFGGIQNEGETIGLKSWLEFI